MYLFFKKWSRFEGAQTYPFWKWLNFSTLSSKCYAAVFQVTTYWILLSKACSQHLSMLKLIQNNEGIKYQHEYSLQNQQISENCGITEFWRSLWLLSSTIPTQIGDNQIHLLGPCPGEVHWFLRERNYNNLFHHFIMSIDFFPCSYRLFHVATYAHCLSTLTPVSRYRPTE